MLLADANVDRNASIAEITSASPQNVLVRYRTFVVAAYVAAIPWEVSKLVFPVLRVDEVGGRPVSLIELSRIVLIPLVLLVPGSVRSLVRERNGVLAAAIALLTLTLVGVLLSPDLGYAIAELLRLMAGLAVLAVAATLDGPDAVSTVCRWFRVSMMAAAVLVLVEAATGHVLWNEALAVSSRYNGPFADPNIAARFLLIAAVMALCDRRAAAVLPSVRRRRRLLRVLEVGILLAATAATGSRGVFVAAIAAIVAAVIVPDRRIRRQSARLLALGIVSSLGLALISASFRDRLETFRLGFAAGGARTSFVRAGWEMFLDRPIAGHGLGGYAENLLGRYSSFQSYYGGDVVASHTALVTTLAETGLIGIVGTFVVVVVVVWLLDTALRTTDVAHRSLSIGIALSCVVIFVASQAEGRFVEEPLLYPLVGLLAVCARSALPPSSPRTRW